MHRMGIVIPKYFDSVLHKLQPQLVPGLLGPTVLLLVMASTQCPVDMGFWLRLCLCWLHNTNVVLFLAIHCTRKVLAAT